MPGLLNEQSRYQTTTFFKLKKSEGQAVVFHSPVFVQARADEHCLVLKQDESHFARSGDDDVIK